MRALMFFNVDISGGVCCGRRNEITAPRTSDCNGKRELINDIRQMSTNSNIYSVTNTQGELPAED